MTIKETINTLREIKDLLTLHKVKYVIIATEYIEELERFSSSVESINERSTSLSNMKKEMLSGMGSLNDLIISRDNGHEVQDEKAANRKLEELRRKLRVNLGNY